MITLSVAEKKI